VTRGDAHYQVEINGRTRRVTVTRTGAGLAVSVDGHLRQIDAARIDGQTLSLLVDNVWSRDITVVPDPDGRLMVGVGGARVPVNLNGGRRGRGRDVGHDGSGPERIPSPMPGKVVRVLVAAGDAVKTRQPLLVVEAMKMENEIRAGRDGVVADVPVRPGQSVDAGALLVVIQ
jgi:biotin carboxyl carrier protein